MGSQIFCGPFFECSGAKGLERGREGEASSGHLRQKAKKRLCIPANLNDFEKNIFEIFCKKLMFGVEKVSENKKGRM